MLLKKDVYKAKIKNIEDKISDITNLANNASRKAKINDVKGEIPCITNLVTKASLNAKINDVKNKMPTITNLAITTGVTAVANKIPNVNNLVTKTDYNTKINEIEEKIPDHNHDKYITTPEFNKLTLKNFAARLAQANLARKSGIANFAHTKKKRQILMIY